MDKKKKLIKGQALGKTIGKKNPIYKPIAEIRKAKPRKKDSTTWI